MFDFFRKKRIKKYTVEALKYIQQKYIVPVKPTGTDPIQTEGGQSGSDHVQHGAAKDNILYSDREVCVPYVENEERDIPSAGVKYSLKQKPSDDNYNASEVSGILKNYATASNYNEMLKTLENNVNQTFVDKLLYYIKVKGVRDSQVYKAAHVDKRLFSKIVSNYEYKPSKDTVIALSLALELSLDEANDMLSRAGYALSHSNKRDIIIEFFFREKVYDLLDVNDVLFRLNQKIIGRF